MIDLEEVFEIHEILIKEFGGSQGIRDEGLLKSAIERPFSGSGETEFYKRLLALNCSYSFIPNEGINSLVRDDTFLSRLEAS